MSKYSEMCSAIEQKIKSSARPGSKPACVTSSSDLTAMMHAMLNSPDHEVPVYTKKNVKADGSPVPVMKNPSQRLRESLKPTLRHMGLDKADTLKMDTVEFSKEQAAAMMDAATFVIKDYLSSGRRFVFPITKTDEAQMSLRMDDVEEKVTKPNRFVQDENGRSIPQPTGKVVTTKAHNVLKARNAVPFWLRETKDSEE